MRVVHILITALIILTVTYAVFRAETLITGPDLTIFSPMAHERVPQLFTLDGNVKHAVYLSVNDRRIYPDSDGFFEKELVLPAGHSIVKVYARNRHGQEKIIHLPLYTYETNKEEKTIEEDEITADNEEISG